MSRITRLSLLHSAESSPLAASHVYWQASIDDTHRWQQALGWAALATPATGMGCLCGPRFAARRVERGTQTPRAPAATRMLPPTTPGRGEECYRKPRDVSAVRFTPRTFAPKQAV